MLLKRKLPIGVCPILEEIDLLSVLGGFWKEEGRRDFNDFSIEKMPQLISSITTEKSLNEIFK